MWHTDIATDQAAARCRKTCAKLASAVLGAARRSVTSNAIVSAVSRLSRAKPANIQRQPSSAPSQAVNGSPRTLATRILVIIAVGLLILIPTAWAESVAQRLARGRKEERAEEASSPTAIRVIQAVLGPITVIIYLVWSFVSGDWHITWIVWPIMGLLFAVLGAASAALKSTD